MNRRGFLRGVLVSAVAAEGTALVKLATPAQAAVLAANAPVLLGQPEPFFLPNLGDGEVYVRRGRGFQAIGYLTQMEIRTAVDEVVSWTGEVCLVPGLKRGTVFFEGQTG